MNKGFTLLEVCLAVTVMATGVLSVVILYSMGFRETRQSREDVASAAYADAVMSPLVSALSSTNLKWSVFKEIPNYPGDKGWGEYVDANGRIVANPEAKAQSAFSSLMGRLGNTGVPSAYPSSAAAGLKAGLLVMHSVESESAVVKIAFRATRAPAMLMSAPLYYTEVHFQGVPE